MQASQDGHTELVKIFCKTESIKIDHESKVWNNHHKWEFFDVRGHVQQLKLITLYNIVQVSCNNENETCKHELLSNKNFSI